MKFRRAPRLVVAPNWPDASVGVDGVAKHFKGIKALNGVFLQVREGEIHGMVGPNGSGKTTIFNVLSGIHPPTSGHVRMFGMDTTTPAYAISRRGVARTFRNLRVFSLLSVCDNILVGLERTPNSWMWRYVVWPFSVLRQEAHLRHEARHVLGAYGLTEVADALPSELSYGAQPRVEIARATASDPEVLLLDEPAAGLNGEEVEQLRAIVNDVRSPSVTVLIIEYNMGLVMLMCDRMTVLSGGTVIADDVPDAVVKVPAVIEAYLGDDAELEADVLHADANLSVPANMGAAPSSIEFSNTSQHHVLPAALGRQPQVRRRSEHGRQSSDRRPRRPGHALHQQPRQQRHLVGQDRPRAPFGCHADGEGRQWHHHGRRHARVEEPVRRALPPARGLRWRGTLTTRPSTQEAPANA